MRGEGGEGGGGEEWVDAVSQGGGMRVVGGRWVPWWIVLVGRKRGGDGGGGEGVARRRVERFGVGDGRFGWDLWLKGVGCMWGLGTRLCFCVAECDGGLRLGAGDRGIAAERDWGSTAPAQHMRGR